MSDSEDIIGLFEDNPEFGNLVDELGQEHNRDRLHQGVERVGVHINEELLDSGQSAEPLDARTLGWVAILYESIHDQAAETDIKSSTWERIASS